MDAKAIRTRIGHKIKLRRAMLDMQQGELAQLLGMKQAQLSRIEQGESSLKVEQLVKLATVMQCPAGYFLDEMQLTV